MPTNAGNVMVRFSVQDQEVVRKALEQLGTDGQAALRRIDAAGAQPSGGLKFLNSIMGDLRGQAMGLAAPLGGIGQGFITLGTGGLVAAAALGGVIALFGQVREGAKAFGEFARGVRDVAEMSGLSIPQQQAFVNLLQRHGVESEKATSALDRFARSREEAAHGGGPLYEALRRENGALAEQFAGARSSAEAIDIFARAIANADQKTRGFLLNAAFGRGSGLIGAALGDLAGQGGIDAVTEARRKAGVVFDEAVIRRQADAAVAAQQKAQLIERAWNSAYAAIYQSWKDFKQLIGLGPDNEIKVALVIKTLFRSDAGEETALADEAQSIRKRIAQLEAGGNRSRNRVRAVSVEGEIAALRQRLAQLETRSDQDFVGPREPSGPPAPTAEQRATSRKADAQALNEALERNVKARREQAAVLGDLLPLEERIKLQEDELQVRQNNGLKLNERQVAAIKANIRIKEQAAEVSQRMSLGIASAEELLTQRLDELNAKQAAGHVKTAQEYETAQRIIRREAQQTADALRVRASETPALTRLAIDAGKLKDNLDQELSSALRSSTSELIAMAKGTETLGQGFANLATRIAEAVAQALLLKTVVGPLAGGFSGLVGSLFGPAASPALMPSAVGHNALGTNNWPGGWSWVGERGPELLNIPRGAQVSPPSALAAPTAAGNITVNLFNAPAGTQVDNVSQARDPQGSVRLDVTFRRAVLDVVAGDMGNANGALNRLLRTMGIDPTRRG